MENNVLSHHGILGMHWGIRRYQYKDGTLTPAGRRRLEKLDKEREKINEKNDKLNSKYREIYGIKKEKDKINIKELSNEELSSLINRINLEKKYLELTSSPKNEKGKGFVQQAMDNFKNSLAREIPNFIVNATKTSLTNSINKKEPDELAQLKRLFEIKDYQKKIKDLDNLEDVRREFQIKNFKSKIKDIEL